MQMQNGIIINGVEYKMHKTSDLTVDACQKCDLKRRCGQNALHGPCALDVWNDRLRLVYFTKSGTKLAGAKA